MKKHVYNYLFLGLLFIILSSCEDKKDKTIVSFHETGEKYEEYQYIADSLKHGYYRRYSDRGFLLETSNYLEGKLEGERIIYNFNSGVKEISEIYKNDILEGRYILFHPNGEMNMLGIYKNNVLSGTVSFFDSTGGLSEEVQFVNNFQLFPFQEFHENGKIKWEGSYKYSTVLNRKTEFGLLKEYNEDGKLIRKKMCDEKAICTTIWSLDESSN